MGFGEIFRIHPLLNALYTGNELLGRECRFRVRFLLLVMDNLLDLTQYGIGLFPQPLVVFLYRASPDEAVFIGRRFDFRAVYILYFERYEALLMEQFHDLAEQVIEDALQTFSSKIIDCPEVGLRAARKPHVMDVFPELLRNAARRIDVVQISVNQNLEHLARMETAVASSAVGAHNSVYIQTIDNGIHDTYTVRSRN